jgi:hypothetical protein
LIQRRHNLEAEGGRRNDLDTSAEGSRSVAVCSGETGNEAAIGGAPLVQNVTESAATFDVIKKDVGH